MLFGFEVSDFIALSAVIIATLGIIATTIISVYRYKIEAKKSSLEKIIDCAYKEWESTINHLVNGNISANKKFVYPLSCWLLFYQRFFDLLNKKNLKKKDIDSFYKKYKPLERLLLEKSLINKDKKTS